MKIIAQATTTRGDPNGTLHSIAEDNTSGFTDLRPTAKHVAISNMCHQMMRDMFDMAADEKVEIKSFHFRIEG